VVAELEDVLTTLDRALNEARSETDLIDIYLNLFERLAALDH